MLLFAKGEDGQTLQVCNGREKIKGKWKFEDYENRVGLNASENC
jgi:hypothetical protein